MERKLGTVLTESQLVLSTIKLQRSPGLIEENLVVLENSAQLTATRRGSLIEWSSDGKKMHRVRRMSSRLSDAIRVLT